jgi:hypothetical protein
MSTQHTPGPWINRVGPSADLIIEGSSEALFPPMVATVSGWHESGHQIEALANARLIAAAPDLLAALEVCAELLATIPNDTACKVAANHARAAILKANGNK